jgi:hypothetical protein
MRQNSPVSVDDFAMPASVPFPPISMPSRKITVCTTYAHHDWNIPEPKTAALLPVYRSFRFNCARVRFLMLLPVHIGGVALHMQRVMDIAEFQITETPGTALNEQTQRNIASLWGTLFDQHLTEMMNQTETQEESLADAQADSVVAELLGAGPPPTFVGLDHLFSAYLTGAWTAFETLCGDLWEAALNAHPHGLAHLNGSRWGKGRKRDSVDTKPKTDGPSKSVALDDIASLGFDVRTNMGTLLRRRYSFQRLSDIRDNYGLAFDKHYSEIRKALMDKSIDALTLVRNIIVHRGGSADQEYMSQRLALNLPLAGLNRPIILDGESVVGLIEPVMTSAKKILAGVDSWVSQH